MEKQLKLFLVSQDVNRDYDTYDSFVVVAYSEDEARQVHPSEYSEWGESFSTWADSPEQVKVEEIGIAHGHLKAGQRVCCSYNAG